MKKIILLLMLCIVSMSAFAGSWSQTSTYSSRGCSRSGCGDLAGGLIAGTVLGLVIGKCLESNKPRYQRQRPVYYQNNYYYNTYPNCYPAPIYYEPAPVYYQPVPVYYQPAPVYYYPVQPCFPW